MGIKIGKRGVVVTHNKSRRRAPAGGVFNLAPPPPPQPKFEPCDAAVYRIFHTDPKTWDGEFCVHCTGKTGELLFLTGAIPSLRKHLPKAKLTLATQEHYREFLKSTKHQFDAVLSLPQRHHELTQQVALCHQDYQNGFTLENGKIIVNCYRAHGWPTIHKGWPVGSFYQCFTDAIGGYRSEYETPAWDDGVANERGEYVLALPSLNHHSSPRRTLPVSESEWIQIADTYARQGLACLATGHSQDPRPPMPGWTWIDCDLVEAVRLARYSRTTIAGNSGMAFVAGLLSRGQVLIIDESPHRGHPSINARTMYAEIPEGKIKQVIADEHTLRSKPWIRLAKELV